MSIKALLLKALQTGKAGDLDTFLDEHPDMQDVPPTKGFFHEDGVWEVLRMDYHRTGPCDDCTGSVGDHIGSRAIVWLCKDHAKRRGLEW